MVNDLVTEAHAITTAMDIHELVARLNSHLGATAVAALANVRDSKLPYRWAKADGPTPNAQARERLQAAHRAWLVLADAESDHVARSWFLGANPLLDEEAPILVLRSGRIREVLQASEAFAKGTWHG
ncbi:hypothetical protein [Streptomyces sp. ISID311]|uniref:hypothetical protein n=1 Tax=Streptomyces sp. ISID311 TaxID=2601673 RepID=UPI0011BD392A|nr:hypothetical protein [Streptomyces sp. ISID311]TXC99037.1 hypothetical protein FS847_06545 [Streptomyces sp. ISID311]